MILLIDNYDSFVYNLSRYFVELGCETLVVRNDAISVEQARDLQPQAIVLSPGPCTPEKAGVSIDLVRGLAAEIPMLGVCLGHQAIATAFGLSVVRAEEPVHGRTSLIHHHGKSLFRGLPNPLRATRYHSLVVREHPASEELTVTARTEDGTLMAIEHRSLPVFGVQFHPESVLTECGHRLLQNFLAAVGISTAGIPTGEFTSPPDDVDQETPSLPDGQALHW